MQVIAKLYNPLILKRCSKLNSPFGVENVHRRLWRHGVHARPEFCVPAGRGKPAQSARTKTAKVLEQKAFREQLLNFPGFRVFRRVEFGTWPRQKEAPGEKLRLLTRNLRNRLYLSTVRRIVYLSSQSLALTENSRKARPQVRCKMTSTVGPLIASSRSAGIFCRIFVPILFGVSITPAFANPVFIVRGSPWRLRKGGSRVETDFHT